MFESNRLIKDSTFLKAQTPHVFLISIVTKGQRFLSQDWHF